MEEGKKLRRSSMKNLSSNNYFSKSNPATKRKITFDLTSLALKEKISNRLIKDSKTPYVEFEGDDDDYFHKKIKIINTFDPLVRIHLI